MSPSRNFISLESVDALSAGALGFMPRILVLTTLRHRRPKSHRFERVNGRHTLRMPAPRRVGLPYGSYPRLLSFYLATAAAHIPTTAITRRTLVELFRAKIIFLEYPQLLDCDSIRLTLSPKREHRGI